MSATMTDAQAICGPGHDYIGTTQKRTESRAARSLQGSPRLVLPSTFSRNRDNNGDPSRRVHLFPKEEGGYALFLALALARKRTVIDLID